jgi:hypothetical protein
LLVISLYERYLHRLPDTTGLAGFAAALDSGTTENAAATQILISAEYYSKFEA